MLDAEFALLFVLDGIAVLACERDAPRDAVVLFPERSYAFEECSTELVEVPLPAEFLTLADYQLS